MPNPGIRIAYRDEFSGIADVLCLSSRGNITVLVLFEGALSHYLYLPHGSDPLLKSRSQYIKIDTELVNIWHAPCSRNCLS